MSERIAWIKAKGGLGNRMLCAASGMLWAELAGRRPFVDWRDDAYSLERENAVFHFFSPPGALREPPCSEGVGVTPAAWNGRLDTPLSEAIQADDPSLHSSPIAHRRYSVDARRFDQPEPIAVFWHYTGRFEQLAGKARRLLGLSAGDLNTVVGACLERYLPIRAEIADEVERFRRERFAERTVGVHVRMTDRTTDLTLMLSRTRRLAERLGAEAIFLATDNASVSQRFRDAFPRVIETEKWLPAPGEVMHQSAACADRRQNGIEALVDMRLLAACDGLVYASRSTFSYLSHCLGSFPPGSVADVDRYDPKIIARKIARRLIA